MVIALRKIGKLNYLLSVILTAGILFSHSAFSAEPILKTEILEKIIRQNSNMTFRVTFITDERSLKPNDVNFNAPDFLQVMDFKKVYTTSVYENDRFILRRNYRYEYKLRPQKSGPLQISNINVTYAGKSLSAPDITVEVEKSLYSPSSSLSSPSSSQTGSGSYQPGTTMNSGNSESSNNGSFFIKAVASKNKAYVGEEVIIEFWAYRKTALRDIQVTQWPSLPGFWKEDLVLNVQYNTWKMDIQGTEVFKKALLARYAAFPIKKGDVKVDQLSVKAYLPPQGGYGFKPIPTQKSNRPITISVLPLPSPPTDQDFSGIVGNFSASWAKPSGEIELNKPFTLSLMLSGKGNLKPMEEPDIKFPGSFEVFDTVKKINFTKDLRSDGRFDFILIPRKVGDFEIPAYKTTYFSPKSSDYKSITGNSINITVSGDAGNEIEQTETDSKKDSKEKNDKPFDPKSLLPESSITQNSIWRQVLILILIFGAAVFAFITWRKRKKESYVNSESFKKDERLKNIQLETGKLNTAIKEEKLVEIQNQFRKTISVILEKEEGIITVNFLKSEGLESCSKILDELNKLSYAKATDSGISAELKLKLKESISLLQKID